MGTPVLRRAEAGAIEATEAAYYARMLAGKHLDRRAIQVCLRLTLPDTDNRDGARTPSIVEMIECSQHQVAHAHAEDHTVDPSGGNVASDHGDPTVVNGASTLGGVDPSGNDEGKGESQFKSHSNLEDHASNSSDGATSPVSTSTTGDSNSSGGGSDRGDKSESHSGDAHEDGSSDKSATSASTTSSSPAGDSNAPDHSDQINSDQSNSDQNNDNSGLPSSSSTSGETSTNPTDASGPGSSSEDGDATSDGPGSTDTIPAGDPKDDGSSATSVGGQPVDTSNEVEDLLHIDVNVGDSEPSAPNSKTSSNTVNPDDVLDSVGLNGSGDKPSEDLLDVVANVSTSEVGNDPEAVVDGTGEGLPTNSVDPANTNSDSLDADIREKATDNADPSAEKLAAGTNDNLLEVELNGNSNGGSNADDTAGSILSSTPLSGLDGGGNQGCGDGSDAVSICANISTS
ncbi:hypothetical protein FRC02_006480 [Tulasnella sp. 418]|nr:hypothetical protein FRC02_006480 [Tulasnella sp. 418]